MLEYDQLRLVALGEIFNRDISGLSQAARRLQRRLREDENLAGLLEKVKDAVGYQ